MIWVDFGEFSVSAFLCQSSAFQNIFFFFLTFQNILLKNVCSENISKNEKADVLAETWINTFGTVTGPGCPYISYVWALLFHSYPEATNNYKFHPSIS